MKNVNRMVWANSFSNDKRLNHNKEPYKKTCKKCKVTIWMKPNGKGWQVLDLDGKAHKCKTNKTKKKQAKKLYTKKCNRCGNEILMMKAGGQWRPFDMNKQRHRCPAKQQENEILAHMKNL